MPFIAFVGIEQSETIRRLFRAMEGPKPESSRQKTIRATGPVMSKCARELIEPGGNLEYVSLCSCIILANLVAHWLAFLQVLDILSTKLKLRS